MSEDSGATFEPFIVVITFLAIVVVLIAFIPSEFFIIQGKNVPTGFRDITYPEQFEAVDLLFFVKWKNDTVPYDTWTPFELSGWAFQIWGYDLPISETGVIALYRHEHFAWIFQWGYHTMHWYNIRGEDISLFIPDSDKTYISGDLIDQNYDPKMNSSKFLAKDDVMQVVVYFNYNRNTYDTCYDAWKNNDLYFLACCEFDQQNTGMNAWSFLSSLLFFRLPDIHLIINSIIALPIWFCIVWLVAMFIYLSIKALPFT